MEHDSEPEVVAAGGPAPPSVDRLLDVAPVVIFGSRPATDVGAGDPGAFYISANAAGIFGRIPVDLRDLATLLEGLADVGDESGPPPWTSALGRRDRVLDVEVRLQGADDAGRWVRITSAVHPHESDLIVGCAWDITDRLEATLAERDARAAAERSRDRALAANRAKTEFLSRMSHELRTPLNSIVGFGQLLELQDLGDTEGEWVAHVVAAGEHLLNLINEVLDVAGIEAGKLFLSIEPVDLLEVIEHAVGLVRASADERAITIEVAGRADSQLWVLADRQRVLQIVLNLLSNAVRYNDDGGAVTLAAAGTGVGGGVRLEVTDTGMGIPEELWARVFEPFDRLGAERLGIEGTGMGMALSRSLAERMGGSLDVASKVGDGSTFTLVLPEGQRPSARNGRDIRPDLRPAETTAEDEVTLTVLYIEDNVANLRLMESVLELRSSVDLLSAMRGRVGLEIARDQRPDLVMVDLHLPDVDGADVLRQIRADASTSTIPVAVVSADATPTTIEELKGIGADYYLTKPIDIAELIETIDNLLERKRGRRG